MSFEQMTIAELTEFLSEREELSAAEAKMLESDNRSGAKALLRRFYKQKELRLREEARLQNMLSEERQLQNAGFEAIAGVDEAGRGPLAGPVVAAAVILNPDQVISDLKDSKQLSAAAREKIFDQIVFNAGCYGIGSASHQEIDQLNIHVAAMLAMKRAIEKLSLLPDFILVDGGFTIRDCNFKQKAIKKGDDRSLSIAAASVLAKVTRDKIMAGLDKEYPQYGFLRNMGYGTAEHCEALSQFGPCPVHRRSFRLIYD